MESPVPEEDRYIAFISDTQAPMWVEGLFLRSNNNMRATELILNDILKREPLSLFWLGDVVSLGHSNRTWVAINYYLKRFADKSIPVFAILGNHELMQRPAKGERNFQKHFPEHVRTGYVKTVDSVAVVMLNSNFTHLPATEIVKQDQWYANSLKELDADPGVKAIIVTCHHSPFTNSRLVSSSAAVQQRFLPPFIASEKCNLFLSGHAHVFEHFRYEGKDFLVIGGGGGLTHPLRNAFRLPDKATDYKPPFHYLLVRREQEALSLVSYRIKPDFSGIVEGKKLSVPLAKSITADGS